MSRAKGSKVVDGKLVKPEIPNAETVREESQSIPARTRTLDARTEAERIRRERKGLSGLEQRMAYFGEHPGWKRRWVNDDNVPFRLGEGYRFVEGSEVNMSTSIRYGNIDIGDKVSYPVGGSNGRGDPRLAFLMEIPQEIADELDKAKSHDKIAAIDQSIRSGTIGDPGSHAYVPKDTPITLVTKNL